MVSQPCKSTEGGPQSYKVQYALLVSFRCEATWRQASKQIKMAGVTQQVVCDVSIHIVSVCDYTTMTTL